MKNPVGHSLLLLGEYHGVASELTVVSSGNLAAATCVGDERAATWRHKGYMANEDAISGRDQGRFARLVVADAHFGHQASHTIVAALHDAPLVDPEPALELFGANDGSETTLTSLWLDRDSSELHVHNLGDSQALLLRRGAEPLVLHAMDGFFTSPSHFNWDLSMHQQYQVLSDDVLVAYTDGVHECHRGHPQTSIRPEHVSSIFEQSPSLEQFVRELATTALVGRGPNPGGEDNIAIVAVQV